MHPLRTSPQRWPLLVVAAIERISDLGTQPGMPPELAHRVRLSNRVAVLVAVLLLPYLGLFAALGQLGNAVVQVLGICGLASVIVLNVLGRHGESRFLTLLIGNLLVLTMAARLGRSSGIHFYGFAAVIAPLFFYPRREWRAIAGFVSLTGAIMLWGHIAMGIQRPLSPLPDHLAEPFYMLSAAGGLATTFAFVLYFYSESSRLADSLRRATEQMKLLSETDELTQLANRRKISALMSQEWSRAARGNYPLAVVMIDVDYFKTFNDLYGHLVGDVALARIGIALRDAIHRPYDLAGRFGGEEFLLLLPESDAAGAQCVAERARLAVEKLAIPHAGNRASPWLTCSFGVSSLQPAHGGDPEMLQRLADDALYRAKELGRNRVVGAPLGDGAAGPSIANPAPEGGLAAV